ncbi:transcriptional regulator, araC family [Vibrio ishigakensis]|uniref:Transcriptional regulator, araC family n=1 Tax=Vibrio ishigakensis TaxID=1481914 RepID=A0A0B8NS89_9VIBR|nr:AraC family transcriptional regulator [Vibrio ishigakensis]GAM54008.1 transcriptional regulator, araC family [Vibrio ishigakensis]
MKHPTFSIVPEQTLFATLPPHLRQRFEVALELMHEKLYESLSWEMVAEKSAISPHHFHRQFSELFQETPGHYLSRIRLQQAVHLLMANSQTKVIDIAHSSGYSSSQALAKVLKRELGVTANEIRLASANATPDQICEMLDKLSHPRCGDSFEKHLAMSMPTELVWYVERGVKVIEVQNFDWDTAYEKLGDQSKRLLTITPIKGIDREWRNASMTVADWGAPTYQHNGTIKEGYYLCCEVLVLTDVAYITAIKSLFEQANKLKYQVDESRDLIEMMLNVHHEGKKGATFSFQLPVKIV